MIFYFLTEKTRVTSPGERRIFKLSRYIMSKNFQKVLGFEIISIFFLKILFWWYMVVVQKVVH